MKVSEIKVSYSNTNTTKVKVTSSEVIFKLMLDNWNLDVIEYQEIVKLILLNRANVVLGIYELSKGGISGTVVDIRIVLGVALKCNASAIILAHNHPSENLKPSEADKLITSKLKDACKLLDLVFLDHLIISRQAYFSFADSGIL